MSLEYDARYNPTVAQIASVVGASGHAAATHKVQLHCDHGLR